MYVTIADAKARFAEIVRLAEQGEDIVLTRYGKPVVRMGPTSPVISGSLIGALSGKVHIAEDFDDLPDSFLAYFEADEAAR